MEPTAEALLDELEQRLFPLLDQIGEIRRENAQLQEKVGALVEELEAWKQECRAKAEEIERLRLQRDEVVKRVARIRDRITDLSAMESADSGP